MKAAGKLVKIETDVPRGPAGPVLMEASRDAEMICVGSVGIGLRQLDLGFDGSQAGRKAHLIAVMLKVDRRDINFGSWCMTDAPDNGACWKYALPGSEVTAAPPQRIGGRQEESGDSGRRRFERRVQDWHHRHPDVRVYPITTHTGIARFLADHDERVRLAVIESEW